jgi:hypothetical protein
MVSTSKDSTVLSVASSCPSLASSIPVMFLWNGPQLPGALRCPQEGLDWASSLGDPLG